MNLLFENLQTMSETQKLEERNAFNPQTYIDIKRALNKNNFYKDKFFLNTDLPEHNNVNNFKFALYVKCAIMDDVRDWQLYHGRDGVGVNVGKFIINLIDETIDFTYYLDNVTDVAKRIKSHLSDIELDEIIKVIESGIENVKKLFSQKNFYYRLTNKMNRHDRWSDSFTIKDEQTEPKVEEIQNLTEDFDSTMPTWLMKAIRQDHTQYGGHTSYGLPLDTMKWEITEPPTTGKLPREFNDVIACLIDISGEAKRGNYIVYSPKLQLGNELTIRINGRDRRIETMSMKSLAPYIKEFAIAKNVAEVRQDVTNKRDDRFNSTVDTPQRVAIKNQNWLKTYDKSGYLVDPEKYKKMLAKLHQNDYATRLEELYVVLTDCKLKIKEFLSRDDFLPDAKDDTSPYNLDYGTPASKFNEINRLYTQAARLYRYALGDLDGISAQKPTGYLGGEAYKEFNKHLAEAETNIVKVLDIVEHN